MKWSQFERGGAGELCLNGDAHKNFWVKNLPVNTAISKEDLELGQLVWNIIPQLCTFIWILRS